LFFGDAVKRKRNFSEDERKGWALAGVTFLAMAFLNISPLPETIMQKMQFGTSKQNQTSRRANATQTLMFLTAGGLCLNKALSDEQ
jgi:hypothetical protein